MNGNYLLPSARALSELTRYALGLALQDANAQRQLPADHYVRQRAYSPDPYQWFDPEQGRK